jgi:sortase A
MLHSNETETKGTVPKLNKKRATLMWAERVLLAAGGILLAVYAAAHIDSLVSSRRALQQFDRAQTGKESYTLASGVQLPGNENVDFSLWSQKRIQAFTQSLSMLKEDRAMAVLGLDRLRIRVPVFEGTDELALNRGAGWIVGTARPGEAGNTGIAGHRDGFFRGLKDVQVGDLIELQISDKTMVYRVSQTEIVTPEDVGVLKPRGKPSLTLVTCYPFYYIGSAPKRFIVHAILQESNSVKQTKSRIESQS